MRQQMINNAMAYNRVLTEKYLETKSDGELLCFTHPIDRADFKKKIYGW